MSAAERTYTCPKCRTKGRHDERPGDPPKRGGIDVWCTNCGEFICWLAPMPKVP